MNTEWSPDLAGEHWVGARVRAYNGGGYLMIAPDYLALRPSRPLVALGAPSDLLVHTKAAVTVYRSRLSMRTGIVIEAECDTALAVVWSWMFEPIARHLDLAGFQIQVERTACSVGGERVSPWEL